MPDITPWHTMDAAEVCRSLGVSQTAGLPPGELAARQAEQGGNVLTPRKPLSPLWMFLLQFHHPLVYILLASTLITALLREWVDASVILGVVLLNAVIGSIQELKARSAMQALTRAMTSDATVIRNGSKQRVDARELTCGDIVLLASGDKVPADLRILECRNLRVDESALTGESLPTEKGLPPLPEETLLADRRNMAYSSTLVTYGSAVCVVTAIGDETEIGRINRMIGEADVLETPLTRRIAGMSRLLLWVILGLAAATFAVGLMRGGSPIEMFKAAVALGVGAIPEGLPAALTITLAIGVSKMARRRAIIRKLPAVETLGSTSIICSDKTGTLTQNRMTVQVIAAGHREIPVPGTGYDLDPAQPLRVEDNRAASACLLAGVLCNDAVFAPGNPPRAEGDPTELALLVCGEKAGISASAASEAHPRIDSIPFESQHQYMATLHADGRAFVKGSAEQVLSRCTHIMDEQGQPGDMDPGAIHAIVERLASEGLRVLAFAEKRLPGGTRSISHEDVQEGLVFLGLQAMIDPPREESISAVAACRRAGITVKMITGDHELTARAIARRIGIVDEAAGDAAPQSISGARIARLSDEELRELAHRVHVFARVSPEDKLRLVKALQADGSVIAMTGDGVNDGPSLRQANIGIAMGITGTEVAKEASDMVLTDDNFATIEAAVEEGRGVYDNLVKFITWTLPTNFGEGLVILLAVFSGVSLPILPVQILWINMSTAVLLGLMLAFEPKEPGIMNHPPRKPSEPLLTPALIQRVVIVGLLLCGGSFGLFEWGLHSGHGEAAARTLALNIFVFGELFYLFNCRSLRRSIFSLGLFGNPWVFVGAGLMALLQVALTYAPPMQAIFHTAPIGPGEWGIILAFGILLFLVMEAEKKITGHQDA